MDTMPTLKVNSIPQRETADAVRSLSQGMHGGRERGKAERVCSAATHDHGNNGSHRTMYFLQS